MRAFVAITDWDWFEFLRARPDLDEIDFWQPGGQRRFSALQPGQPFLFKLHSPRNFIVGGGFFAHSTILPVGLVWDTFGEKNGAGSLEEMRARIEKYRRAPQDPKEDYQVGCVILQAPFFLHESEWIPVPRDFHANIVQGKSYSLSEPPGRELWQAVEVRLAGRPAPAAVLEHPPMWGPPRLVAPRLGQGTFRALVLDTYERRCAVTREKALPVLEAAHIRPVGRSGEHRLDNGLLLRRDVHALFDAGYVTVTRGLRLRVSRRLRGDFDNGEHYLELDGREVWVPRAEPERPAREFLEWHGDVVFKG